MYSVLRYFENSPRRVKVHTRIRWKSFPFPKLLEFIPDNGLLIDIGSGHGLWPFFLADRRPELKMLGIDPDAEKIRHASEIATHFKLQNLQFAEGVAEQYQLPESNVISIIDVMYLIPYKHQERILTNAVSSLKSGGRLIMTDARKALNWKFALCWAEEWLAVNALKISWTHDDAKGKDKLCFRSESEWERLLSGLGLKVKTIHLDKGYLHPHILFVGVKQ